MNNWKPIETAPKDGREILLWLPAPYSRVEKAHWFEIWGNWQSCDFIEPTDEYCGIGSELPTHWQPLPEPPTK